MVLMQQVLVCFLLLNCLIKKNFFFIVLVDGGWTPWSVWSDCSVTCGQGNQIRTRACIDPPPRNNGTHCPGADRETQLCHTVPCLGNKGFITCFIL